MTLSNAQLPVAKCDGCSTVPVVAIVSLAERSKALHSGRSLFGGVGLNPTGDILFCMLRPIFCSPFDARRGVSGRNGHFGCGFCSQCPFPGPVCFLCGWFVLGGRAGSSGRDHPNGFQTGRLVTRIGPPSVASWANYMQSPGLGKSFHTDLSVACLGKSCQMGPPGRLSGLWGQPPNIPPGESARRLYMYIERRSGAGTTFV